MRVDRAGDRQARLARGVAAQPLVGRPEPAGAGRPLALAALEPGAELDRAEDLGPAGVHRHDRLDDRRRARAAERRRLAVLGAHPEAQGVPDVPGGGRVGGVDRAGDRLAVGAGRVAAEPAVGQAEAARPGDPLAVAGPRAACRCAACRGSRAAGPRAAPSARRRRSRRSARSSCRPGSRRGRRSAAGARRPRASACRSCRSRRGSGRTTRPPRRSAATRTSGRARPSSTTRRPGPRAASRS